MTKKRLKELVVAFNEQWPRGVHGAGGFGKAGTFAAASVHVEGFDRWGMTWGAIEKAHGISFRDKDFFTAFDPVTIQEMLVTLCELKVVKGPNITSPLPKRTQ